MMVERVRHDARRSLVTPDVLYRHNLFWVHGTILTPHLTSPHNKQLPVGASAANLAGRNLRTDTLTIFHTTLRLLTNPDPTKEYRPQVKKQRRESSNLYPSLIFRLIQCTLKSKAYRTNQQYRLQTAVVTLPSDCARLFNVRGSYVFNDYGLCVFGPHCKLNLSTYVMENISFWRMKCCVKGYDNECSFKHIP